MKLRTRILIDARELIADESLWAQGSMETTDDPPRRCLSGAICAATGVDETQIEDNPIIDKAARSNSLNEAIAASEPCADCETELTARTWHLLTLEGTEKRPGQTAQVLCDQCSLFYGD